MNLESATTLAELKDASSGDYGPYDHFSFCCNFAFEGSKKENSKHEYFSRCVADNQNDLIWASSSSTGTVSAFTTADEIKSLERRVGFLAFAKEELQAQSKFCAGGDCSMWSPKTKDTKQADEDKSDSAEYKDEEDEEQEEGCDYENMKKRSKVDPYKGIQSYLVTMDNEQFATGDVQAFTEDRILIGQSCDEDSVHGPTSHALRLFDLKAESVVGLFCGSQS